MNLNLTPLDLKNDISVRAFLDAHYRYHTMGSHNRATSFAHCVKIDRLGLGADPKIQAFNAKHGPNAAHDAAYQLLGLDCAVSDACDDAIADFTKAMHGWYTIGTNGRSGGYLVLYNSRRKPSDYKSRCRTCGQMNYQLAPELAVAPLGNACGRCAAVGEHGRHNLKSPLVVLETRPGQGIGEDLDALTASELRELARVVLAFDETCLDIRANFINLILEYEVTETVLMVPKTVKSLVPRESGVCHG